MCQKVLTLLGKSIGAWSHNLSEKIKLFETISFRDLEMLFNRDNLKRSRSCIAILIIYCKCMNIYIFLSNHNLEITSGGYKKKLWGNVYIEIQKYLNIYCSQIKK
jgi:hypothetical protein